MTSLTFDSLRYARRLRQSGMPEPQADAQAELMAESFGIIADKVLTKEHFEAVLRARLDAGFAAQNAQLEKRFASIDQRFTEQDAKFEQRFTEQDAKFEQRFTEQDAKSENRFAEQNAHFENRFVKLERTLFLHTWMLGLIVLVLVVPQLQAWLA